jgi:uncharacterized protein (TIGR02001 family)
MKRFLLNVAAAAGLVLITAAPVAAQPTFSVNAAVTNNYVWRGITQSDEDLAVQGGADVDFGNGLAIGTWASTVDFNDGPGPSGDDGTTAEIDIYGSYSGMFGADSPFGYTVGAIGYLYAGAPDNSEYNFFEIYGGLSAALGPATFTGRVYYSPELGNQHTFYWTGGVSVPIANLPLAVTANVGHYDYEFSESYTDYNIGLSATWQFITASLTYTGTDIDGFDEYLVGMLMVKFPLGNN